MAGVPLRLDTRPDAAKRFAVSASLRIAFNAYVAATSAASAGATTTEALATCPLRRLSTLAPAAPGARSPGGWDRRLASNAPEPSIRKAYQDLIDANDELEQEWQLLENDNPVARQREVAFRPRSLECPTLALISAL